MASAQTSVYERKDRHIIRLRKICDTVCRIGFRKLLSWLTCQWDCSSTTFEAYLRSKGNVSMTGFKSALKPDQKKAMRKDPQGDSWDVTLLFLLITWGNEFLADKDDPIWKTRGLSLEFLITSVKNERNSVMHTLEEIDESDFFARTEGIRKQLTEMLNFAGKVCSHVSQNEIDITIQELNDIINKCRDDPLDPKNFNDYKNQLMFPHQRNLVLTDGKAILCKRHSKYEIIAPVSHLVRASVPLDQVYTKMVLETETKPHIEVTLENLLTDGKKNITNSIILVVGEAGIGKTTLTRKIVNDWSKGKKDIQCLECFDIVLHAECRDYIDSFKGLLSYSMPEVAKSFLGDDMIFVIGDLKTLVVLDSLDELNPSTTRLFKEILQLKEVYDNLTVLVTTRPEAEKTYFHHVKSSLCTTKHIKILGIPPEKRGEFVRKYCEEIKKQGLVKHDFKSLLQYLERTENRLGYLWLSPYNLTLLIVLWVLKRDISSITTAPELNWEIIAIYFKKLEERLSNNKETQHLSQKKLKEKIMKFFGTLCWEALNALVNNEITLDVTAYQRLVNQCTKLKIPVEEMVGMFLKQTTTSSGTRYSFPHKGTQEFLAARYIFTQLTKKFTSLNFQKINSRIQNVLSQSAVATDVSDNIIKLVEEELKKNLPQASASSVNSPHAQTTSVIRDILERLEGTQAIDLPKYQSLLTYLIGMFYQEPNRIKDNAKLEALKLLQETGVTTSTNWIDILNGVKCDPFVASFISSQCDILKGDIGIADSSLFAYISLIQALKSTDGENEQTNISISIREDSTDINELLNEINMKEFSVINLEFHYDFRYPSAKLISSFAVNRLFERCEVKRYTGAFYANMKLPESLRHLTVSVNSEESYQNLVNQLPSSKAHLTLCLGSDLNSSSVTEAPSTDYNPYEGHQAAPSRLTYNPVFYPVLYLPDVNENNLSDAVLKAKNLNIWYIDSISFPKCTLSLQNIIRLKKELAAAEVRVSYCLKFPSYTKPSREDEHDNWKELHSHGSISWGDGVLDRW
ncbi:hypothetical protein SK128_011113 [Halocaridina rubra]|uniref:NACHT domain-containing protein n=1 Tax=Halocaridina rubra TaxID=373956 RepID=A0AAN8XUL3_HALRR